MDLMTAPKIFLNNTIDTSNASWNINRTDQKDFSSSGPKADTTRDILKAIYITIAVLSFVGNSLLCAVIVKKKQMLKRSYNLMILNLAVADALNGIFIIATPDYIFDRRSVTMHNDLAGTIYCRLIGSTYILFIFGKASNLTIMFLAIDRWYSILKPIMYKVNFSKKRLYFYIALIWFISCLTQINELFITVVENELCTFRTPFYGPEIERILILSHVTLTFYIPSIITWCSFAHIMVHMRKPAFRRSHNNIKATHRLLRMCALAALFLSICWLPAETFFVLYKFDIYKLPLEASLVLGVLAMFNSCLNPFIYCLSNKEYRREFMKLLCCSRATEIRGMFPRVSNSQTQYSFSNATMGLSTLSLDRLDRDGSFMTSQQPRKSVIGEMTSSQGATLKRYSYQETSFHDIGSQPTNANQSTDL